MTPAPQEVYEFGSFRLEVDERRLTRGGVGVPIAPKLFDTLVVLVRGRGRLVLKETFVKEVWPDAFVTDVTLAHNISALRKILGHTDTNALIETVAKKGYRFVAPVQQADPASAAGGSDSPPSDVLTADPQPSAASASEEPTATPRERAAPSKSIRHVRRVLAAAAVAAAIVLLVLAVLLTTRRNPSSLSAPDRPTPVRTLAVLPFTAVGDADPVLETGLADTLIARLGGVPDLKVRPLSAVRRFAGKTDRNAMTVGRQLDVDVVLEGTVVRDRDTVRVRAHLVQVAGGAVIWSASFDEPAGDVLRLQDALVSQVAATVMPQLRGPGSRVSGVGTTNAKAYEAYLKGRYFFARRDGAGLRRAIDFLETAVRLDPGYALAHNALADAYHSLGGSGFAPQGVMIPKAKAEAQAALALNPTLADPWATLALIAMNYDWQWDEAERLYRRALAVDPRNATAHAWYGEYLGYLGRFDEGLLELRTALTLDPLSLVIATDIGRVLILARRYDDAVRQIQGVLEMDPDFQRGRDWMAIALSLAGRHNEAVAFLRHPVSPQDEADLSVTLAPLLARSGKRAAARAKIEQALAVERSTGSYHYPPYYAIAFGSVGDLDRGFAELDRMCVERTTNVINLKVDPVFDPFRRDPRFDALLHRVGLAR